MEEAYEKLAAAIILQAVNDYRRAVKTKDGSVKRQVVTFIRSKWFRILTGINPAKFEQKLKEEALS